MMNIEEQIKNSKILIIDDQRLHIRLLESILNSSGYENIASTTDPRRALTLYAEFKPDLILLDVIMPHVDGFQIMAQLTDIKKNEYLPILVFTVEKDPDMRLRAFNAGATDFINIPYESVEVLIRIRNILESRILHLQLASQNKLLEVKVSERTKELRDTRLDIIRRLARAAEYRDNDTGIHIIRMSQLCVKLGEVAGLNDAQCELLLDASPLHDVGKIGIPDNILLKPGKLTEDEFEIMKTHTTIGAELLGGSDSALMEMARTIALTHHERWDGTGYPKKIKAEDIPLMGRICCICDVFDALTSNRPYKKPWSTKDAFAEIEKQSGKQFDSNLVKKFLNIATEIREIKDKYIDV